MFQGHQGLQKYHVEVPDETKYRQQPNELCLPASWTDIFTFFVGNYVTHAATVGVVPGARTSELLRQFLWALLIPTTSILFSAIALFNLAALAPTTLQKAARAEALFMVERDQSWKPKANDVIKYAWVILPRISLTSQSSRYLNQSISQRCANGNKLLFSQLL